MVRRESPNTLVVNASKVFIYAEMPGRLPPSSVLKTVPAHFCFLLPLAASCAMIKCRKQLRGVTALLGLEYRGKAAFIFACFQRQTVLYFEQRPSTLCSSNPRIPCGLCRRSLGSPPAICSLNLRILRGHHRRASIKFFGNLLASALSAPVTVPPEGFYKALRQSTSGIYGFCTGTTGGFL